MVFIMFLMVRLEYIYKSLLSHHKFHENIAMFNSKSAKLQKDINLVKSKSFDTVDTNIVLQHRYEQVNHEIELLKYKQRCCHNEIQKLKDLCSNL